MITNNVQKNLYDEVEHLKEQVIGLKSQSLKTDRLLMEQSRVIANIVQRLISNGGSIDGILGAKSGNSVSKGQGVAEAAAAILRAMRRHL